MATYRIMSTGNVIVAESDFVESVHSGDYELVADIAPPSIPEPENAWWIYVGPFYDRFGLLQIPILASADPTVQACIKSCQVRKYIDLKRPDVSQLLDLIIGAGFAIDKTAILTTPVPINDRYTG